MVISWTDKFCDPIAASKIEELYVSLHKKSAEVYIHRSGQLYSATPMRHKLFQWTLDNLEIVAMADPTLHGKENVVTHMKEIDQERYFLCHACKQSIDNFKRFSSTGVEDKISSCLWNFC